MNNLIVPRPDVQQHVIVGASRTLLLSDQLVHNLSPTIMARTLNLQAGDKLSITVTDTGTEVEMTSNGDDHTASVELPEKQAVYAVEANIKDAGDNVVETATANVVAHTDVYEHGTRLWTAHPTENSDGSVTYNNSGTLDGTPSASRTGIDSRGTENDDRILSFPVISSGVDHVAKIRANMTQPNPDGGTPIPYKVVIGVGHIALADSALSVEVDIGPAAGNHIIDMGAEFESRADAGHVFVGFDDYISIYGNPTYGPIYADNSLTPNYTPPPLPAPVATDESVQVDTGSTVTIDVLANDTGDRDTTTLTVTQQPARGTASVVSGKIVYVNTSGAGGETDTIQYTVANSQGLASNAATVSVTLSAPPAMGSNYVFRRATPISAIPANLKTQAGVTGPTYPDLVPEPIIPVPTASVTANSAADFLNKWNSLPLGGEIVVPAGANNWGDIVLPKGSGGDMLFKKYIRGPGAFTINSRTINWTYNCDHVVTYDMGLTFAGSNRHTRIGGSNNIFYRNSYVGLQSTLALYGDASHTPVNNQIIRCTFRATDERHAAGIGFIDPTNYSANGRQHSKLTTVAYCDFYDFYHFDQEAISGVQECNNLRPLAGNFFLSNYFENCAEEIISNKTGGSWLHRNIFVPNASGHLNLRGGDDSLVTCNVVVDGNQDHINIHGARNEGYYNVMLVKNNRGMKIGVDQHFSGTSGACTNWPKRLPVFDNKWKYNFLGEWGGSDMDYWLFVENANQSRMDTAVRNEINENLMMATGNPVFIDNNISKPQGAYINEAGWNSQNPDAERGDQIWPAKQGDGSFLNPSDVSYPSMVTLPNFRGVPRTVDIPLDWVGPGGFFVNTAAS